MTTQDPHDAGLSLMLDQMIRAADAGLYFPALSLALTVPDMCSALGADDGRTTGPKYKAWVEAWLGMSVESAAGIYRMRCRFLHEGRVTMGNEIRVAFMEPVGGNPQLHNVITNVGPEHDRVLWMSIPVFAADVAQAVNRWWLQFGSSHRVQRNLEHFVRRHPEGLRPHTDLPVIC